MSEELEGAPAPETTETTDATATQPNVAAVAAIVNAQEKRRIGRPPRNPAPASSSEPAPAPIAAKGTRRRGKGARRRQPKRAELAAIVREQREELRKLKPAPAPIAATPSEPAAAPATMFAGDVNAETRAKFAKGVSRLTGAITRAVARRKGIHWQFDQTECDVIGEDVADCVQSVEELAPEIVTPILSVAVRLTPFAFLAGALYETVDSRIEIDQEIAAGKRAKVMPGETGTGLKVMTS